MWILVIYQLAYNIELFCILKNRVNLTATPFV